MHSKILIENFNNGERDQNKLKRNAQFYKNYSELMLCKVIYVQIK